MHWAALNGHIDCVMNLLEHKADRVNMEATDKVHTHGRMAARMAAGVYAVHAGSS